MKLSYAFAAFAVVALSVAGCGKKEADDTFVTVNGDKISTKEFVAFMAEKSTVMVSTPQGTQAVSTPTPLGFQGMEALISQKLLLQLAKDQGVLPTNADVDKELDFRTAQQADYLQQVTQAGITLEQIKADILVDLARERLWSKGVVVTPAEVDQYIKENPKQFSDPAKANLLVCVVTSKEKKAQVDKDLAGGASFQTVATRYSEDPQARQTGGQYPVTDVSQMPAPLQAIVEKTAALKSSDWIANGPAFVKIFVQSKTAAKPMEMTPARKERVQRNLSVQRGQLSNDLSKKQLEKLQSAQVTISQPLLDKMWGKYMEQAKKQAAAAAAPAGGAQTGAPPTTPPATTGGTAPAATGGAAPTTGGAAAPPTGQTPPTGK